MPVNRPKQDLKDAVIDNAIIDIAKHHPEDTTHQIGIRATDIGLTGTPTDIYRKLKKSDYLSAGIEAVRANNTEFKHRKIIPKALEIHNKVLNDKAIDKLDKREWVAMAERMDTGEQGEAGVQQMVNIDKMQVIIQAALDE